MPSVPGSVNCYQVSGRTQGTGPLVAVFTDGPSDLAVAATAAAWTADTRTLLVAAVAVPDTGLRVNPLLHRAWTRRSTTDSLAIVGRVTPILTTAGAAWLRTVVAVPAGTDPGRTLPIAAVRSVLDRFAAVAVVATATLHDPSGHLRRTSPDAALSPLAHHLPAHYR